MKEQSYYALFKGHELVSNNVKYWVCDTRDNKSVFINFKNPLSDTFVNRLTKKKWNALGVNDSNADFVKVDEHKENADEMSVVDMYGFKIDLDDFTNIL